MLTRMRTSLLQDCSQQPVPDGFTQPPSECLRDKRIPFAMARQLLSGKVFVHNLNSKVSSQSVVLGLFLSTD